ncbi:MAG: hydrogenase maturation protease, partial [Saprospiraceae bacterium]|nr:hydrogenase maturation protease [Saprospiraceae bacterium]
MKEEANILIAGVGNDLRQDDAFGIELLRKIESELPLPSFVKTMEVGIGGIHLVQELSAGYQQLILLDAVNWGEAPGHIYWRAVEVKEVESLSPEARQSFLADMHYANPNRALMLAKAVGVLPEEV